MKHSIAGLRGTQFAIFYFWGSSGIIMYDTDGFGFIIYETINRSFFNVVHCLLPILLRVSMCKTEQSYNVT